MCVFLENEFLLSQNYVEYVPISFQRHGRYSSANKKVYATQILKKSTNMIIEQAAMKGINLHPWWPCEFDLMQSIKSHVQTQRCGNPREPLKNAFHQ